jgi:hypothetical protein
MMFDSNRLELAKNALHSLDRMELLRHTLIFPTDATAASFLDGFQNASYWPLYTLTAEQHSSLAIGPAQPAQGNDYGTPGFERAVLLKFAVTLAMLGLGYGVLWLDADVVALGDPLRILEGAGAQGDEAADLTIQFGAAILEHKAWEWERATGLSLPHVCTGVFAARPRPSVLALLRRALAVQACYCEERGEDASAGHQDDQTVLNALLFERDRLGLGDLRVHVLDAWQWPMSDAYHSILAEARPEPVLVHVNLMHSADEKAEFMRAGGLWRVPPPPPPPPSQTDH